MEPRADCNLEQPDISAFVSDGHVSLLGSGIKVPETDTGDYILMRGMGLTVLPVPLHKLELDCGLVQGEVAMGAEWRVVSCMSNTWASVHYRLKSGATQVVILILLQVSVGRKISGLF
ncbi:hypothetical protein N1851_006450 [Merluccius polli]|uniref:Uncharacterized protein n=1 Tax=Merluccius polli TaxID=89951 RepID=A0AA47P642_MERPO|nr:hypothetical protein N1851_006450 [Merluccius polli]